MENMEKKYRHSGPSWNGEWDLPETGIRSSEDIDDDNIQSIFNVWALGDYGTGEHSSLLTGLERMIFDSCWPGAKVSRHEVNVHDGTTNSFKAEILSRRIKCDLATAQKFIEVFRGLQLRSQDVDRMISDGFEGLSFKNPEDLPKIFIRLVNIDGQLPELPVNPTVEYTDEGWVKYRLGYNNHGQLVPEDGEDEWDWPDPENDDLTAGGTPDVFRSIPIGWNSRREMTANGWQYTDPRERDFFSSWFPCQAENYRRLFKGIGDCNKHSDLSDIGKAIHADPEVEKLSRVQQSILWTKYNLQKAKLEQRTRVFADRLIKMVNRYSVNQKFNIDGKTLSMGQLIFKYQKEHRLNLSGVQWTQVWEVYKTKKQDQFRPDCSNVNF